MSKCNLLQPLRNNTGNYYLFSQYTEDLTKEYTQKDYYRVVPSYFVVADLNVDKIPDDKDLNIVFGEIFQNYYENACSFLRKKVDNWKPEYANYLLWQTLINFGLINVVESKCDNIKHLGDINIYNNSSKDGVSYNELYCLIDGNAKHGIFSFTKLKQSSIFYPNPSEYIEGFEEERYRYENALLSFEVGDYEDSDIIYNSNSKGYRIFDSEILYDNEGDKTNVDSFKFNTIILFYDIYSGTNKLHAGIPMGMYVTGVIDNAKKVITNSITKYISNDDIYGQGTSYGLRVCSKYLSTQNATVFVDSIAEFDDIYDTYSKLMTNMNESQVLMEQISKEAVKYNSQINEHLALFRNNKTNVPYTREINGKKYWFVNGKNTGAIAEFDNTKIPNIVVTDNKLGVTLQTGDSNIPDSPNQVVFNYYNGKLDVRNGKIILNNNELNINNNIKVFSNYQSINELDVKKLNIVNEATNETTDIRNYIINQFNDSIFINNITVKIGNIINTTTLFEVMDNNSEKPSLFEYDEETGFFLNLKNFKKENYILTNENFETDQEKSNLYWQTQFGDSEDLYDAMSDNILLLFDGKYEYTTSTGIEEDRQYPPFYCLYIKDELEGRYKLFGCQSMFDLDNDKSYINLILNHHYGISSNIISNYLYLDKNISFNFTPYFYKNENIEKLELLSLRDVTSFYINEGYISKDIEVISDDYYNNIDTMELPLTIDGEDIIIKQNNNLPDFKIEFVDKFFVQKTSNNGYNCIENLTKIDYIK